MSIHYLNTSTQMKIRPVSDEDVLFEMETNHYKATCGRVDVSHDLVIRDITSGYRLFCISGAEIEDHPVDVYISDNHHVGRIEGMDIYIHGQTVQTVRIQRNDAQYTIQEVTVIITAGLVTLKWPRKYSVELIALSIVFALNIAMTKHKDAIIGGRTMSPSLSQVKRKFLPLLLYTEKQACPKRNKSIIPSIFAPGNIKQEFWLKAAGWNENVQTAFGVLMNKWNTQVVLYVGSKQDRASKEVIMNALNLDGEEEYTGAMIFTNKLTTCSINYQGKEIGKFTFNLQTGNIAITCIEENTITEIFTRSCRKTGSKTIYKSFVDENNRQYGTINDYIPETLEIELAAGISSVARKIIICCSSYYYSSWTKKFKNLPRLRLSKLTCNCYYCQKPNYDQYDFPTNRCLFEKERFLLKPLGHNKSRNIKYFISCTVWGGLVDWTLEVTPIQNFVGVAKIEGRSYAGELMFTSIFYQQHNLVTIYDWNNKLVAYIENDKIRDLERNVLCVISQSGTSTLREETRFGPNVRFFVNDMHSNARFFAVSSRNDAISIYRSYFSTKNPSISQVMIECTLSIKLHSDVYGLDKIPTPEIVYCYCRTQNMRIEEIFF